MRKLKIAIMMIIILLITGSYKTVFASYLSKSANVTNMSIDNMLGCENLYCVWYGQVMDYNVTYYRRTIITIEGNSVYFEQYNRKHKWTNNRSKEKWKWNYYRS